MSIKFPDFQVLVSRSDQIPRTPREGDPTGAAGKLAPQVADEFAARQQRVEKNKQKDRVRDRQDSEGRRPGQQEQEGKNTKGRRNRRRIDLRA